MNWNYVDQGQQAGPVSEAQLAELFRTGKINADTLVWREGLADWILFRDAQLAPTPPAAPPSLTARLQPGEVTCAECGRVFPGSETIRHGNVSICAACKPVFLQKLAEGAKFDARELVYAGFGIRFLAKLVDGLILGVPALLIGFLVILPTVMESAKAPGQPPTFAPFLVFLLEIGMAGLQIGYQTFFLGRYGATPGKMLCKIKVVNSDGSRFGYGRAVGRTFAEMLSGMACDIGYLLVLFDNPQRRALHDHICNTRVVYK